MATRLLLRQRTQPHGGIHSYLIVITLYRYEYNIYSYINIYMEVKKENKRFNVSVIITSFKTLNSWKVLLKQWRVFDEIVGKKERVYDKKRTLLLWIFLFSRTNNIPTPRQQWLFSDSFDKFVAFAGFFFFFFYFVFFFFLCFPSRLLDFLIFSCFVIHSWAVHFPFVLPLFFSFG